MVDNSKTWDKFYSVYMFDNIKYHKLVEKYPNTSLNELKEKCFVRDDKGNRIHLGDQKHIYRINTLHNIQTELAGYCEGFKKEISNYWDYNCSGSVHCGHFTLFYERYDKGSYEYGGLIQKPAIAQLSLFDTKPQRKLYNIKEPHDIWQVEIDNTCLLPIKDRVTIHLKVLKLCRKGIGIKTAVKSILEASILTDRR